MLYHAVRAVHRGYALALFWLYLGLFGVAFLCIFVFPPATLALLFLGIFGLVVSYLGGVVLGMTENSLARRALRRDTCPRCGSAMEHGALGKTSAAPAVERTCRACGARFEACGSELEPELAGSSEPDLAVIQSAPPTVSSRIPPESPPSRP